MAETEFKFLLVMPVELDGQVSKACSNLHQSKSAFIRESIRQRLNAMESGEGDIGSSGVNHIQIGGRFDRLAPMVIPGLGLFILVCYGFLTKSVQ